MNKTLWLFKFGGLQVSAKPNAILGTLMLWAILTLAAIPFLDLSIGVGVFTAFIASLLHWLSGLWHQTGHAFAAKRAGWPMIGIGMWWLFTRSIYPKDEPDLPAEIHIQRALGGVPASLLIAVISGIALSALSASQGPLYWTVAFFFLDNFLVFSLGALMPLGFTDGSTLLYWLPRRGNRK